MKFNFLVLCFCFHLFITARSQPVPFSSYAALAEKIYVQLDNRVYTTDQTIWFKAILANAADHTPSKLSGVLYVDLIDPHENVVEHKLIKIEGGVGNGFFGLALAYAYGLYQIRAYTEWNKNFGSRFFFTEYVLVSGPETGQERGAIRTVTVVEGEKNSRRVQVSLDPAAVDSIAKKAVTLFITLDEKRDTLTVRKNKSDQYVLDYPLPPQSRFLTLGFETEQHVRYSRTVVLDTAYPDVRFFPESGELVQGLPALVGVKVVRYDGKGQPISGTIVNSKGLVLAAFKTNELGMGSVRLNGVDSNEHYAARIFSAEGKILPQAYLLPTVAARGTVVGVSKSEEKIRLKVRSNYLSYDSMVVRASCRGVMQYYFKGQLKNGLFEFSLPAASLPEGIIEFTLLTQTGTPVAGRLYFNERPETRIGIAASADKQTYAPREKTQLSLEINDSQGRPVAAQVSLFAFYQSGQGSDLRQHILSYFLLSSDLKGAIENPGFYFSKEVNRFDDLDALLLTQGWSNYHYTRDSIAFLFQPEPGLTVSGNVKGGLFDKKIMKGANLTLMTSGKPPSFAKQKTDSLGRFVFSLEDAYGPTQNILIQSADKSDKQKDYLITLDQKREPEVEYDHRRAVQKPDSIVQAYIEKSITNKKAEDAFKDSAEGHTLQTVVVKTRFLSPQQKRVTDRFGKATVVIDGQEIRDKEEKWSYGLYSVLLFRFPDKVRIQRRGDGTLYASLFNNEPTLVVIDGIPVLYYEYDIIPGIAPSEVKSFEVIPYAKNFFGLYCETVPRCDPLTAPMTGNVIAIYTYAGKGIEGARPVVGLKKTAVPVFSSTREFYSPRYDQLTPKEGQKPDLRNLVQWAPNLKTDTTGKCSLSFYNADAAGTVKVVVEAISESGELGYQEVFYEVKKRE